MQYRLSTIFLVFFVVATSLSWLGIGGLWLAAWVIFIAILINKTQGKFTIVEALVVLSITFILVSFAFPSQGGRSRQRHICVAKLISIGRALQLYRLEHGHFPPATVKNERGEALYGWRVEILPELGYRDSIYKRLNRNEPWDSPHNKEILNPNPKPICWINELACPSSYEDSGGYVAITGPKIAWQEDGNAGSSDSTAKNAHAVMVLELVETKKNWAEADSVTIDELKELLASKDGRDRLSHHPALFHVLLADGSVWGIPKTIPVAEFEKLVAGEFESIDDLKKRLDKDGAELAHECYNASETWSIFSTNSQPTPSIYAFPFWLLSVFLLFRRAFKSRAKVVVEDKTP
jgi:type II secretory pathway pseudopilin PulG